MQPADGVQTHDDWPAGAKPGFENVHLLRRTPGARDMYHARYDRDTDTLTEVPQPLPDAEE